MINFIVGVLFVAVVVPLVALGIIAWITRDGTNIFR